MNNELFAIFNPPVKFCSQKKTDFIFPAPSSGWHLCIVCLPRIQPHPGFWISYVLPFFFSPESLWWNSEDGRCNRTKTCSKRTCFVSISRRGVKPTDLKDGCVSSLRTFTSNGHPIILSDNDSGAQSPPERNVFRFTFHHHSQARNSQVIGWIPWEGWSS